jgi:hypothetical protein
MTDKLLEIILDELENAQILRFQNGVYELKHDSLTSTIIKKRTAEQEELNDLYATIKQNIKGGSLTQLQLERIEPVRRKLLNKYENESIKNAAEGFIDEQIYQHKKKEQEDEAQRQALISAKERAETAQKMAEHEREKALIEKKNAEKESIKAKSSAKKARLVTKIAIVLACFAVLSTFIVWYYWSETKIKIIEENVILADSAIKSNNFLRVYDALNKINDNNNFLVKANLHFNEGLKKKINNWKDTLLFHLVASKILLTNNSVVFQKGSELDGSQLNNICDTCSIFKYNRQPAGSVSKDLTQYWEASPTSNHKYLIYRGYIKNGNKKSDNLTVDIVDIPTADFDSNGNLYYLKNDSIYYNIRNKKKSFNKKIDNISIVEYLMKKNKPHGKAAPSANNKAKYMVNLEFLLKENRMPSDFLKITLTTSSNNNYNAIKNIDAINVDTSIILNVNGKYLKVVGGSEYYLDSNKNLFYSIPTLDKDNEETKYHLYRWNPTKATSTNQQADSVGTEIIPNFGNSQNLEGILRTKRLTKINSSSDSPNSIYHLDIDSSNKQKIIIKKNNHSIQSVILEGKDTVVGFSAQDNFFCYIYKKSNKGQQSVVFETYDFKKQEFKVPCNWTFSYFLNKDKAIVFRYLGRRPNVYFRQNNLLGMLIMDLSMTQKAQWDNWYRLMKGREANLYTRQ